MKEQGHLSDPQMQEKLRAIHRRRDRQREEDLRSLMSHDWGRRIAHWVMYDVGRLQEFGFDRSIKDGPCASLHHALFAGRQEMAVDLFRAIQQVAPSALLIMDAEFNQATQADLGLTAQAMAEGDALE